MSITSTKSCFEGGRNILRNSSFTFGSFIWSSIASPFSPLKANTPTPFPWGEVETSAPWVMPLDTHREAVPLTRSG